MECCSSRPRELSGFACQNEHTLWGPGQEATECGEQWDACVKYPGHQNFYPVNEFGIEHLPVEWQRDEFVDFIKVWADLTMRLRVNHTSQARFDDGSHTPCLGGLRVGTGYIRRVIPPTARCQCSDCKAQPTELDLRSWILHIFTAKHVVFDDSEVKMTFVDFFHDYAGSEVDGHTKTLMGDRVVNTDATRDWCMFTCICHDGKLAEKIMRQLDRRETLEWSLKEWCESLRPEPQVIVSHPHGCPKYVTLGQVKGWENDSDLWTYTTETCPGSSGAPVIGWGGRGEIGVHHCQGSGSGGRNKGFDSWWC